MADFLPAFARTLLLEGGLQLTDIDNDNGGQTYAGLSRVANPDWSGWEYIDRGETPPIEMVRQVYKAKYWDAIKGDLLLTQSVAESIYDFAVNAGPRVAIGRAQRVLKITEDGIAGPQTAAALNAAHDFHSAYTVAKIAFYESLVTKNRKQGAFLLGWVRRALKVAA